MKVHVLQAEHFSVSTILMKVFANKTDATIEAVKLVNELEKETLELHPELMDARPDLYGIVDDGDPTPATAADWEERAEALADFHGAAHCYVDITECEVLGNFRL